MYLLKCFDNDGIQFQITGPTEIDTFAAAVVKGAVRAIDTNGYVYLYQDGMWKFMGTSTWTQVAGYRAGSQHFSLIDPPK